MLQTYSRALTCLSTKNATRHRHRALPGFSFRGLKTPLNRPGPPPLPAEDQREFEELVKKANAPWSSAPESGSPSPSSTVQSTSNPQPEGDVHINPQTGEQGGPKVEPVGRWKVGSGEKKTSDGDWSFKGRVSDF